MSFRPALLTVFGLTALTLGVARAEDPFLGRIKEIKCVNCKPGWVTLVVHDPIETRDFELYLKDSDYNKIIAPLPGKNIRDRDGQCFYWMEKPKAPKSAGGKAAAQPTATQGGMNTAGKPGAGAAGKADGDATDSKAVDAAADSASMLPVSDSGNMVPPPSFENEGTPSACIRFFRQMN